MMIHSEVFFDYSNILNKFSSNNNSSIQFHLYIYFFFSAEIIMLDGLTVVYRSSVDLYFYVMGSQYENEVSLFFQVFSF